MSKRKSEEQIITILKRGEADLLIADRCYKKGLACPPFTSGVPIAMALVLGTEASQAD